MVTISTPRGAFYTFPQLGSHYSILKFQGSDQNPLFGLARQSSILAAWDCLCQAVELNFQAFFVATNIIQADHSFASVF